MPKQDTEDAEHADPLAGASYGSSGPRAFNSDAKLGEWGRFDFFVVGPPRTGVTWLYHSLKPHTNVPQYTEETHFFRLYFSHGLRWYEGHFGNLVPGRPTGETDPTYFASEPATERIKLVAPNAKIICTLREPVERIFSLYKVKRAHSIIPWTFEEALERDPELLDSARYAYHLARWQKAFGVENVLPTFHHDLVNHPQAYVDRVGAFIGLPHFDVPPYPKYVDSSGGLTYPRSDKWTYGLATVAERLKARRWGFLIHAAKRSGMGKLFMGGGSEIKLDPEVARRLREQLTPEIEAVEAMLGCDLGSWKTGKANL